MCTAATYQTRNFYFGRNLDYERSYGESVVIMPRNRPLPLRHGAALKTHYAMIGMAHMQDGFPLYYDAVNEKGLCIAGLNFVGNAVYHPPVAERENVAQFELIPWLLGRCATLTEARQLLERVNITDTPFCAGLPAAQLHWMVADRTGCLVVESVADGVRVYDDPAGVLTNNPPFPMQLFALNNYAQLSPEPPVNRFAPDLPLETYSRGMGAMGLPGDLSSQSRFVRAAFVRANSVSGDGEAESLSQLFHILGSVEQQRRLLPPERWGLRADAVHRLLQRRPRRVLLHHLRQRADHRRGHAPRRSGRRRTGELSAGDGDAGALGELKRAKNRTSGSAGGPVFTCVSAGRTAGG